MKVVYHPGCLSYSSPGHPESPDRVAAMRDALRDAGYDFIRPEPAKKEDLLLVHSKEMVDKLVNADYESVETPPIEFSQILLSAGAVIRAAKEKSFALTRPPGHHAGPDYFEGFCYANNTAIALEKLGMKAAIIDLDVHHGNGTQDIVKGRKDRLYVSLHQVPLYPMTGLKSESNCHNFPLFPETAENDYIRTLEKALVHVSAFRPEIIAVSMGFDTYEKDPLAGQKITESGYAKIGRLIAGLNIPVFISLEGGYNVADIGKLCLSFLDGFR